MKTYTKEELNTILKKHKKCVNGEPGGERADLSNTNLSSINLRNADLRNADLSNTNLSNADLWYADLRYARNIPFIPMACPDTGSFIGWKKALSDLVPNRKVIVKLAIPANAKRSSATGRTCRCDMAKVLEIQHIDENEKCDITEAYADYYDDFKYTVGETASVENFEDDRHIECAPGIHFFINREEAVRY